MQFTSSLRARRRRVITDRKRDRLESGEPCRIATFCACFRAKLNNPGGMPRLVALSIDAISAFTPRYPLPCQPQDPNPRWESAEHTKQMD
jgi:hypothetical protein